MRRTTAAFVALALCSPLSARAQSDATTLAAICDQAAASPFDKSRPAGVAGVPPDKIDPKIAGPACEAAAKAAPHDPRLVFQLGRAYMVLKDYGAARAQFAKADQMGYPLATNNLASLYDDGLGVIQNHDRARELIEKAASAGSAFAMNNLGRRFYEGKLVARDYKEAKRWFEKAAALGEGLAMNWLGVMYHNGQGVPLNYAEARRWYEKAAAAGDISGMYNLAYDLIEGRGGPKNDLQARRLTEKAAAAGNVEAMALLGWFNAEGRGGPKDIAEARRWYEKAIAAGSTDKAVAHNLRILTSARHDSSRRRRSGGRSYDGNGNGSGARRPSFYLRPGGPGGSCVPMGANLQMCN
jgi:uncharacterized protein